MHYCLTGTHINDEKLDSVEYEIQSGDVVKFGAIDSFVCMKKAVYVFCPTRLDKPSREKLKVMCKIIGASIANSVDDATHIVTNSVAATVKLLKGIIEGKKVVTISWVESFAGTYL